MPTIRTAASKGSPLTPTEADANMKRTPANQASNYSVTAAHNHEIHELNNGVTATLPTASSSLTETDDFEITFVAAGATATVARAGSQTINGETSISLTQYQSVTVAMNPAFDGWYIKSWGVIPYGVSTFMKTVLDDTSARSARQTLGVTTSGKAQGAIARHANLLITNGTTAADQITLTADEIILTRSDGLGDAIRRTSVSITNADITNNAQTGPQSGYANGFTRANDQWAYLWVISNGSTNLLLFDDSATSPDLTGLSGYDYTGLVGAAYTNSSGDFISFYQRNTSVACEIRTAVSGGTATTSTAIPSFSNFVPAMASKWSGQVDQATSTAGNFWTQLETSSSLGRMIIGDTNPSASAIQHRSAVDVRIAVAQSAYYRVNAATTAATIYVSGWEY